MANIVVAYADFPDEMATSRWRCFIPAKHLAVAGHNVRLCHVLELTRIPMRGVDAVLAERTLTTEMVKHVRKSHAKLVFTFDDAYTKLPGYASVIQFWRKHGGMAEFRKVLKLTDLNITPSRRLNELYEKSASPFEYVPNYLDDDRWAMSLKTFEPTDRFIIGGGFSAFHVESFRMSGISDALKRLLPFEGIELELYGMERVFGSLKVRGVPFKHGGIVGWYDWPNIMRQFSIAIAPSAGKYDSFRSHLRLMEAGAAGVPYIASNHGPYEGCTFGGVCVENTRDGWIDGFVALLENRDLRELLGNLGKKMASSFFMSKNVKEYERVLLE